MTEFEQQYLGEFIKPSGAYKEVLDAWCEYHRITEEFDRTLPHTMRDGIAYPVEGPAMRESRRHAREIYMRMLRPLRDRVSEEDWQLAKFTAVRETKPAAGEAKS